MSGIKKSSWILIGIFLWGIPTGIFLAILVTIIVPGTFVETRPFEEARFIRSLIVCVPIFAVFGWLYGVVMYKLGIGGRPDRQ